MCERERDRQTDRDRETGEQGVEQAVPAKLVLL